MTFLQEVECDTGDKSVSLALSEFANGYTLYAFKITDGPIGKGTFGQRSKSATASSRLELSFAAAVNENIKVILLYQMLEKSSLTDFTKFSFYARWQWTSRWRD